MKPSIPPYLWLVFIDPNTSPLAPSNWAPILQPNIQHTSPPLLKLSNFWAYSIKFQLSTTEKKALDPLTPPTWATLLPVFCSRDTNRPFFRPSPQRKPSPSRRKRNLFSSSAASVVSNRCHSCFSRPLQQLAMEHTLPQFFTFNNWLFLPCSPLEWALWRQRYCLSQCP